jgi:hypothetical protein
VLRLALCFAADNRRDVRRHAGVFRQNSSADGVDCVHGRGGQLGLGGGEDTSNAAAAGTGNAYRDVRCDRNAGRIDDVAHVRTHLVRVAANLTQTVNAQIDSGQQRSTIQLI